MNRLRVFILALASCSVLQSQTIFPHLEGDALGVAVVDKFKPKFVETYSNARILMYTKIYNVQDSVRTLYSDYAVYLPPNEKLPIQYLAMNAKPNGINAEHIYPQSKGAQEEFGNAFSDLHNLAPSRWEVNEARSNYPFGEIDDKESESWFYKSQNVKMPELIKSNEISHYSELKSDINSDGLFEPREEVKGDIARAVFYFYTMYREEAIKSDPEYFDLMKKDLCTWQSIDPVDSSEMHRNLVKASYQDGQANPFILDCTLASRMYCPESPPVYCEDLTVSLDVSVNYGPALEPSIKIFPNPNQGTFTLDISNIQPAQYQVEIFNASGQLLYSIEDRLDYFNSINMWNAKGGMHIIHVTNLDTGRKYSGVFMIIR